MNLHLKRGLIAFLIAFGMVAIYGAMDIYFDPPVDVPSVGYWAYWLLVKAVLAIGVGFGLIVSALVIGGSWLVTNIWKKSVKISLVVLVLLIGVAPYFLTHLFKKQLSARDDDYSEGTVHCCVPHK